MYTTRIGVPFSENLRVSQLRACGPGQERACLPVPVKHEERAAYVFKGSIRLISEGETSDAGQLLICKPGEEIILSAGASASACLMLLGGEPLDGKRHIRWNFVSGSRGRIEQAKEDWREGRFSPVPEET